MSQLFTHWLLLSLLFWNNGHWLIYSSTVNSEGAPLYIWGPWCCSGCFADTQLCLCKCKLSDTLWVHHYKWHLSHTSGHLIYYWYKSIECICFKIRNTCFEIVNVYYPLLRQQYFGSHQPVQLNRQVQLRSKPSVFSLLWSASIHSITQSSCCQ